jgi:hypothetical protein
LLGKTDYAPAIVKLHALRERLVYFPPIGRHFPPPLETGHVHRACPQAQRAPGCVYRNITSAYDHDCPAGQVGCLVKFDVTKEPESREHARDVVFTWHSQLGRQGGTGRDHDCVKAVSAKRSKVVHLGARLYLHTSISKGGYIALDHLNW